MPSNEVPLVPIPVPRLKARREALGITLETVAERSGFSVSMHSRWEKGEANIPSKNLQKLAAAYEMHRSEIFDQAGQEPFFDRLYATVQARRSADPETSYVARLTAKGRAKMAQKLGEEAVETVIAALAQDRAALIGESADLLFHLLVLLADAGVTPADIAAELARREGVSGIAEKAARPE